MRSNIFKKAPLIFQTYIIIEDERGVENRTRALTWLEMGKGVKLVVNRLGVDLPTIGRPTSD